jgi:hypothetical protein
LPHVGGGAAEALAGRREFGRVAGTGDLFDAEPGLERLNAAAEGRLGTMPSRGGFGEVTHLRKTQEIL